MYPPGYYQSANGLTDGKSCNRTSCSQIHESLLGHWRISNIERVHCLSFGLHMHYAHLTSVWSEYFVNTFVFNSKFYLQIRGCPMGTICAPAYANIFMAEFEKKKLFLDKRQINSFVRLYWWHPDGMEQICTSCAQVHELLSGHWWIGNTEKAHCLSFWLHMNDAHLTSVLYEYSVCNESALTRYIFLRDSTNFN